MDECEGIQIKNKQTGMFEKNWQINENKETD